MGKKDELSLNLIGSHYTTNSSQFDHEWNIANNADVFNNDMNLKAKQTGIVGEIAEVHQFEKGKLSSGYRISNTAISNDLVNLLGASHYDVNYLEQYLYTEYSGKWDKLGYRFGIGITNIHNKSAETTQSDWAPTPKLVLSYDLKKNQSLRFSSSYTSNIPSSDMLSPNVVQTVPNIVSTGNPYLKTQHIFRNNLIYSINSKYLDVNIQAFYNIVDKYFANYYVLNPDSSNILRTYRNADFMEKGIQFTGSIKPFGNDKLVLKAWLEPVAMQMKLETGQTVKYSSVRNNFQIISQLKNLTLSYQFNFPAFQLQDGVFLNKGENASHFFAKYKLGNWAINTGLYWIGMPAQYHTKSMPESLVTYDATTRIFNDKNMFVLGLSYDFSSGKKIQVEKKLENSTAPAATF